MNAMQGIWAAGAIALAVTITGAAPTTAQTSNYPSKTITLVLPFAAGSGTDSIARTLMNRVTEATGWTLMMDNKGGGSGIIAAELAKRAAPDGYTLFYTGNTTHGANSALFKNLPYDPVADFEPITRVGLFPLALLTRPALGLSDVDALVRAARAKPGTVSIGIPSAGPRVATENFQHGAGINLNQIPYQAGNQALTNMLGGQLDVLFLDTVSSLSPIRAGSVKPLAVTSTQRLPMLPDVPTMVEAGYPGFEVLNWSAVFVPRGVPKEVRDTLFKAFADVVASDGWKRYVAGLGGYADASVFTPAQTEAWVKREINAYRETLGRAGVQPE